jgi:hypothetical protein
VRFTACPPNEFAATDTCRQSDSTFSEIEEAADATAVATIRLGHIARRPPQALIPAGDPFAQNPPYSGIPDLDQVNAYRRGVDQPEAANLHDASTKTYCRNLVNIGVPLLQLEQPFFVVRPSPDPAVADSLFTFMALRFSGTYMLLNEDGLNCADLLGQPNPVTLTVDAAGIVIDATFQSGAPMQDPQQLF